MRERTIRRIRRAHRATRKADPTFPGLPSNRRMARAMSRYMPTHKSCAILDGDTDLRISLGVLAMVRDHESIQAGMRRMRGEKIVRDRSKPRIYGAARVRAAERRYAAMKRGHSAEKLRQMERERVARFGRGQAAIKAWGDEVLGSASSTEPTA